MSLQWRYQSRPELGILALAGKLGAKDAPRLYGAIGWTLYHGTGPLILDLAAVRGWTSIGQNAVIESAVRLADARRTLEVAAPPAEGPDLMGAAVPAIRVHADLAAALSAHGVGAEPGDGVREWHSSDWVEPGGRG